MNDQQLCGHEKYKTYLDVGYDISEDGEDFQHLDLCECGMFRMWSILLNFTDGSEKKWVGEWEKDDFFLRILGL